ncbi:MAG: S8 family serine peptidase, partial [Thermoanaerobaculia bacterium]
MIQSRRLLVAALVPFFLLAPQAEAGDAPARPPRGGREVYIVELAGPPLALYRGGVPGLAATPPSSLGERKLDAGSERSLRYVEHLRRRQGEALAAARAKVGREVAALRQYTRVFNGMALELTPEEAGLVSQLPGVRRVQPALKLRLQSDNGPAWIGAPGIWDGTQTGGLTGTKGEGVVIGIVDSGINMDHPSFVDVGGDGYNHTNPRGAGNYVGWCDPSGPDYDPTLVCNDKLISVWRFDWSGPEDGYEAHGTQLASLAAGNLINVPVTASLARTISGAAPHANLIAYDACSSYCYSYEVVAAIDQAVADGVDVLNVSFAGNDSDPWADSVAQALLGAREAGVFVSSAAGNGGSYYDGNISMPASAPWVMAVGASTHSRRFTSSLSNLSGGISPPATLKGMSLTDAYGPAAIVDAADYGDDSCSYAFPAGTFSGQIVFCSIYPWSSGASEAANVKAGGAGGVVLAPWYSGSEQLEPIRHTLPAVLLAYSEGNAVANWLASGTGHAGRILATVAESNGSYADVVASFSSTGPGRVGDVLRPDVLAPGVQILAASSDADGDYRIRSGTSLSSALAAGAAALLIDLHPDWTPAEVQSAMMTTAQASGLRDQLGAAVTSPLRIGAGRLNLGAAARAGLVLDETAADFAAANPANGGLPQALNLASFADDKCVLSCGWTRTVRNTLPFTTSWTVSSIATPSGTTATVTPFFFTLAPGGTQTIQLQLNGPPGQYGWSFGSLTLAETGNQAPPVRLPIATRWLPQYGLTVSKAGSGSGRVTSSPAGIDCGPTCSAMFPDETMVLLTPTPDPGSAFVGWDGWSCYETENPCSVEIWGGSEQVTAYFDLQPPDKALANRAGYKDGMNPPVDGGTWRYYYADLPAGTGELVVDLLDVTGEVTLYVRHASKPTWNNYSCYDWDYYGLPNRRCMITAPAAGRWWIGVNNDQTGSIQYSVRASWGSAADQALSNGIPLGGFVSSDSAGESWKYYYVDLAGGDSELVVDLENLSADADLFVRHAAKPDRSNYSCTSASVGTAAERCTVPSPAAGRWWIGVNNFSPGTVIYDVQAAWVSTGPSDFYTVAPCRLVDTRQSWPVQSGQPRSFLAAGHC